MESVFNNREIAVGLWSLFFLVWAFRIENVRKLIKPLLIALSSKPVVVIFSLMAVYVFIVIKLLAHVELWNVSQLKNTILWFLIFALVELFKANSIKPEENYFATSFRQHVNLLVVFQFVVSMNSFNLLMELILVPLSVFLAMMLAFSEAQEKYELVARIMSSLMSLLGLFLLAGSVLYIVNNYEKVVQSKTLMDLLVPVLLSLFLLPFVYLVSVYMRYESILIHVNIYTENSFYRLYAKTKCLFYFRFDRNKIRDWVLHSSKSDYRDRTAIDDAIENYEHT